MKTEALPKTLDGDGEIKRFCRGVVEAFGNEMERLRLRRGEQLYRRGDRSGQLYFLMSGELTVTRGDDSNDDVELERLTPGSFLGARELLTGSVRGVSVIATRDAELMRMPRDLLQQRLQEVTHADQLFPVLERRLRQQRIAQALRALLPRLGREELEALKSVLEFTTLTAGETLFRQGAEGDDMYLVVSGRLGIRVDRGDAMIDLGDIHRGDIIGEFALFSPGSRSATVVASRDAELLRLHRSDFESLSTEYPNLLLALTRKTVDRVRDKNQRTEPDRSRRPLAVTIIANCRWDEGLEFAHRLAQSLTAFGSAMVLTAHEFDRRFGRTGAAQTAMTDSMHPLVVSILSEIELEHRFVIYVADEGDSRWSRRCLRGCDRLLIVAEAGSDPAEVTLERLAETLAPSVRRELVLLWPSNQDMPRDTAAWLNARTVAGHHHVRRGQAQHVARVGRRLAGRALGLVLSGGGARGYAHLGVWRALEELQVSPDYIGGTSMGALLAAAFAMGLNYQEVVDKSRTVANPKMLFDYTLPFAALMASRKLNRLCHTIYGDRQVEDLWVPFFSVATNLSTAEQLIFRRGPLWRAVRCSISIPGVFAPVIEHGEIIVDGAVMNNFPVDLMREYCESEHVIAVNVSVPRVDQENYDFNDEVSGWRLLLNRLNPFSRRRLNFPAIIGTLLRTMEVNSVRHTRDNRREARLLLEPNVGSVGLLDFASFQTASDLGYEASLELIRAWLDEDEIGRHLAVDLAPPPPAEYQAG